MGVCFINQQRSSVGSSMSDTRDEVASTYGLVMFKKTTERPGCVLDPSRPVVAHRYAWLVDDAA